MASSRPPEPRPGTPAEWIEAPTPEAAVDLEALGLSPRQARMLARRGVRDAAEAERFLDPALSHLHDPFALEGMEAAVERLVRARERGETVVVVGDYDVDGVTAVAQLIAVFRACGISAEAILPHRMRDGYGLQTSHVEAARSLDAAVLVTADCGSVAHEAVAEARLAGLDVVVTDHHLPGRPHASEVVHINPQQESCTYPFADLSGSGLAFKLATALATRVGRPLDAELLLRVASLGTVADMVPLRGENRTIAAIGLRALGETRSAGLRALMRVAGVSPPVSASDVGFRLGPRLNAAGRMDSADDALRLLLTRDREEAERLAGRLDRWNDLRQQTEARVLEEATEMVLQRAELPRVLVAWSDGWHRGVLGIAAGRLSRSFHRPTILLSVEEGMARGSGRSIAGVHLHDFLLPWRERLERFGGHAQAVGLSIRAERLEELEREWLQAAEAWDAELLVRRLEFEEPIRPAEVDEHLLAEVRRLEPFGVGNRRPRFRIGPLVPAGPRRTFGNGHVGLRARQEEGEDAVDLVAWRWSERAEVFDRRFEILASIDFDSYLGRCVLKVVDARRVAESA